LAKRGRVTLAGLTRETTHASNGLMVRTTKGSAAGGQPRVSASPASFFRAPLVTVLVFGCIHGSECAGIAVARALARVRVRVDL
jgi:hypothetical protein